MRIYAPSNSAEKVAITIGGNVAININSRDPKLRWVNTCALRLSYILSQAGMPIPHIPGQTVSGADKRWYFFRVTDFIRFLEQRWGKADVIKFPPSGGGSTLVDKQGIILFEVSGWSNATGHATLFNGRTCYDQCYFNEPGANYRTDRAHFWSLP
ncbi:type VI secretion system amidase effector protein Tae4 [Burkholderia ubonensis]|nr:type VI secretion system amidase effector protein Tae4 [Burkholderia ubonensis]